MIAEITLDIAPLHSEYSPGGGIRLRSSAHGRSFFAVIRKIPGRMVYVSDIAGVRRAVGWTAVDEGAGIPAKVVALMVWVSVGKMPAVDGGGTG